MSKTYPGDIKLARQQMRLADEIRESAYALDPTLRKQTMPRQSADSRRPRHAYDEGGPNLSDLRESHGNLKEACDSLGEMLENKKFPFAAARDHCKAAMDSAGEIHKMLGGGESEDEESSEAERERAHKEAADAVGETPATSVSTLKGGGADPDHRKDFEPIKGKDAAMGLDVDSLLQRNPDDPRARGEAFSARFNNRGNSKQRARSGKQAPQHARDADANYESLDVTELFQKNR